MIVVHGVGPVYWGTEYPLDTAVGELRREELPDQRFLTTSWLVEDSAPYRRSIWAFRVKLRPWRAFHLGICKKASEPPHRVMVQFSPTEIGSWGQEEGDAVRTEVTAEGS